MSSNVYMLYMHIKLKISIGLHVDVGMQEIIYVCSFSDQVKYMVTELTI